MKLKLLTSLACGSLATVAMASDVSYQTDIRPLIKKYCVECHGDESPTLAEYLLDQKKYKKEKVGPRLNTYAELIQLIGWPDTGALMRRLDDGATSPDKKPGNMYKNLGETEPERAANLTLLKAWIGDGAWNLNRWNASAEASAITKEHLDKLKLKY
jgi:hypothetical protein